MKNIHDLTYVANLNLIFGEGQERSDRTGTGTLSMFGLTAKYNNDNKYGFPLLTTKRVHWKSVVGELLWFLSGSTNANELRDKYGVTIWEEWAKENGDLGPIYGAQWRNWEGDLTGANCIFPNERESIDQIKNLIEGIKSDPFSRRHIVSAWNPADIKHMALPPCHTMFQVYVHNNGTLDLQLYQRSADMFLGVPFNIASYSLLMHMIAHVTGYKPGTFIHTLGDVHIYKNHIDAVKTQLSRSLDRESPTIELNPDVKSIFDFKPEDIKLIGYDPYPTIKAPVAV